MRFLNSRGGSRIRRFSSDFMGYTLKFFNFSIIHHGGQGGPGGPGMRSRGPTVGPGGPGLGPGGPGLGPGGARAGARGGQGSGQGGPGLGPGGAMAPLAPPLATGLLETQQDVSSFLIAHI